MLIVILADANADNVGLADGLRAAGHVVRVMPRDTAMSETDEVPEVVVADGPHPAPMVANLAGRDPAPSLIALLDQDSLAAWTPDGAWTDFVVAPVRPAEVAARIALHFARSRQDDSEIIQSGAITIDVNNYSVQVHDERIELTYKEYELLKFLVSHPGRVFTRESLLEQVWGYDYWGGSRTIDVHIRRIRSKLPAHTAAQIETVHQVGYRYALARG